MTTAKSPERDEQVARMSISQIADEQAPVITIGSINAKPFLRLYSWYTNAPGDRPGGPWWYRDFTSTEALNKYLNAQIAFLHAYALSTGDEAVSLDMTRPPADAWLWGRYPVEEGANIWRVVVKERRAEFYCD